MVILQQRSCGGCTACCKTHAVFEIEKPMGKWCPHCRVGKGCAIYLDRPKACKDFVCEWMKGFGKDEHRPDKTKIVLDFFTGEVIPEIFQVWEVTEGRIDSLFAREMARLSLERDIPVALIHLSGLKELLIDDAKLTDEIREALLEEGIRIITDVQTY